jgi:predicted dehydrogenase
VTTHIFQIGCRDIGRLGFEKLIEFEDYFPTEVMFEGIHCRDFDAEDRAEKFAESMEKDIDFYSSVDELYSAADSVDGSVLIYDASAPQLHSRHIAESLRHGFHHLTERPPSVSRDEHISERKLAANSSVNYKVDFIERENPVIQKLNDLVEENRVESVEVFRESSFGVQKALKPVDFAHVKGGAVLDKMSNDIYVLDLLGSDFNFEEAEIDYLMPKELGGEKVMRTDGGRSRDVDEKVAIGKCKGVFSSEGVDVALYASWVGLSEEALLWNKRIQEEFDENILQSRHHEIDGKGFQDEECRFIVLEGEKDILADLMHQVIYDLGSEEVIDVPVFPRDQLYRVLEKAVLDAAGIQSYQVDEDEVDMFMNALFDLQEEVDGSALEEVDKASDRIRSLMSSDKKILDENEAEGVAR